MINTLDISKWKLSLSSNINDANPTNGYIKYFQQGSSVRIAVNTTNSSSINSKDLLVNYDVLLNTEDLYVSLVQIDDGSKYRTGFITNITFTNGTTALIEATLLDSNGSLTSEATYSLLVNNKGTTGNQGFQGFQGHQGLVGTQGVQGTQGQQGYQGYQGHQGAFGLKGPQGYQGFQGNPGHPGNTGPQGGPGPQGPQGDQGFQGQQGMRGGSQGYPGIQGIQGRINYTGYEGAKGVQGPQGYQGFQGPHRGYQGNPGYPGERGLQGPQGAQGPQGPQGVQGYQGQLGNSGYIGHSGPQGYQGAQGVQGDEGFVGSRGIVGAQGPQGFQGHQGNQGFQGVTVTGPQGLQGSQGYQGFQGSRGLQGNQGFQGLGGGPQGVQGVQGVAGNTNSYSANIGDSTVSLLLHMNGSNNSTTFVDNSYASKTITVYGDAKISTSQSKFGGTSAAFDGNGDYLRFDNTSDLAVGSSDFTIEGWVYLNTVSYQCIFNKHTSGVASDIGLGINNSTSLIFGHNNQAGGYIRTVPTISANTWYHFAVVRSSGTITIYWNGTQAGATISAASTNNNVAYWVLGTENWNAPTAFLNGYIDEFRITKGLARYTTNFTPSASAFPNADGTAELPSNPSVGTIVHTTIGVFVCSSTSPVTWKRYLITPATFSVTNAAETTNTSNSPARYTQIDASDFLAWRLSEDPGATTFVSSINPGASTNLTIGSISKFRSGIDEGLFQRTITFQGGADNAERYLRGAAAVTPSSSTSFSASVWIIPYSNAIISGADPYIFGKYWYSNSSWSAPYLGVYTGLNGAGGWGGGLYINGTGLVTFSAKTPLALNYPHLIAVTYDGNYIRLYQNGFLAGISSNYNGAAASYGSGPWYVGKAPVGFPGHSFDGQIWDIRVANTVRTEAYYRNMYLNGTARWG